ncbi:MAG: DHA2 family efflux MFS transporter permease subunit [Rhodospirillales bacterium]|nr:DHA2 family efflux MFS transporter permease subunit [Rhodospirillales bacterium]
MANPADPESADIAGNRLEPIAVNRVAITACVILATLMQALDTTIANVSLPYIQGAVAANQDEIEWVLTSYIVAAAIMTPPTGYLAGRYGVRRVFIVSIVGFTLASMLCGFAQSLPQIVLARLLQGAFGAGLVPLSQAVLLNTYPKERQGQAMAYWGMAIMVGPIVGPVLGGWLTYNYSWRWVFYINVPIGILAVAGMMAFLPEQKRPVGRLDWLGFAALSIAVGSLQMMLDRGQELDWFSSTEIIVEAIVCGLAAWLFLVQTALAREPFVRPSLFRDRNFAAGTAFGFIVGLTYFAPLALLPLFLQNVMNYPILTAGFALAPRGVGTLIAMSIVGRLVGRVDTRLMIGLGLALSAASLWQMTGWTQNVSELAVGLNGIIMGVGMGFIFVPLSVTTLSTLAPSQRAEGAALYTLTRNIGQSMGVSAVSALLSDNMQVNHAELASYVTPFNRAFHAETIHHFWNPVTAVGRAALDAMINQQAQLIAYLDDFKLLMLTTLAALPILIIFKAPPKAGGKVDPHEVALD